jgi:integrase
MFYTVVSAKRENWSSNARLLLVRGSESADKVGGEGKFMGTTTLARAPDYRQVAKLVLDAVQSPVTRAMYGKALEDFFRWWEDHGRPAFTRAAVQAHRTELQGRKYAPSTVNQRLAAIKKLAREAAANGLLDAATAGGIQAVPGIKESGHRVGNWLEAEQAAALLDAPDLGTLKGQRDHVLLALLIGCGLRRAEAAKLTVGHIQNRAGRALIIDMRGKHGRVRTVTVPLWVGDAVESWCTAAGIVAPDERILRSVVRRKVRDANAKPVRGQYEERIGERLTPEAVLLIVAGYSKRLGLGAVRPHDLRRTFAKLCRQGGGELEQIQMLLGHASIQTTDRYLGSRQNLEDAPNDHLPLRLKAEGEGRWFRTAVGRGSAAVRPL